VYVGRRCNEHHSFSSGGPVHAAPRDTVYTFSKVPLYGFYIVHIVGL
jgi:hypothetical protein